uniref:PBP domain-containing protein n=1 Tax=Chromera velia CCMP2878 TaxID=1169474 RepID=A0A0G4HN40_9ALVE|eukprot:Cvel_29300.t1-p1 / transcript=Cvel_29300.t1 / gene=Cvel_29300 / organism=Chromera_velia_CCMP2878 / gene_product=Putative serine/threonine-protein kinase/receptor, putative / transcript_product=Putative serine/threonine-protein kinase/receptor, putative / location=Cvel_scaffold3984:616-4574(-) / protein_length=453 / sequence_SO=supercontig / SO=protein_coding / is_pseudo=false
MQDKGSDSLLSDSDYTNYPDIQMYPAVAGAVVPAFHYPDTLPTADQSQPLVLDKNVLTKIFNGQITTWKHADMIALNSHLNNLPADVTIETVVRSDGSGTTEIFTKACNAFNAAFGITAGSAPDWDTTRVANGASAATAQNKNSGVMAYVLETPGTVGYAVVGNALLAGVPYARFKNDLGTVVEATVQSVQYALVEKGLNFGNDGSDPERLNADTFDSTNVLSWPISSYTYFIMRKGTLRTRAGCQNRIETLKYLLWFYYSEYARQAATDLGFAALPEVIRDFVTLKLRQQILCSSKYGTTPLYDAANIASTGIVPASAARTGVSGSGSAALSETLSSINEVFEQNTTTLSLSFSSSTVTLSSSGRRSLSLPGREYELSRESPLEGEAKGVAEKRQLLSLASGERYKILLGFSEIPDVGDSEFVAIPFVAMGFVLIAKVCQHEEGGSSLCLRV